MIKSDWTLYGIVTLISTIVCLTIVLPIYFTLDQFLAMNLSFYGFGIMLFLNLMIYIGFVYKIKLKHKKWNKNENFVMGKEEISRMTNDPNASIEMYMEIELAKGYKVFIISIALTIGVIISMLTTLIMYYA